MKHLTITRLSDGKQYTEELVSLRAINADLLAALEEAQETLLYNHIDTGHLPGMSQRIRWAIAKAKGLKS